MKNNFFKLGFLVFMLGFVFSLSSTNWSLKAAESQDQLVVAMIDGLSCPFCAYGVEKKVKVLPGVKKIKVLMNEGKVLITFEAEAVIDTEAIKQAVEDSGFTAKEIILPQP